MVRVLRESHEPPEYAQAVLARAGGFNRFSEPRYRVIWGWNRLTWIGGRWEDRDAEGALVREVVQLRLEPKYHAVNRWHIERWCPPEVYGSPAVWKAQTVEIEGGQSVPALGPYPDRGEYEVAFTLEGPKGEFVQIATALIERVARMIEYSGSARPAEKKAALGRREDKIDKDYDKFADDVLSDSPAFHGVPHVTVPLEI